VSIRGKVNRHAAVQVVADAIDNYLADQGPSDLPPNLWLQPLVLLTGLSQVPREECGIYFGRLSCGSRLTLIQLVRGSNSRSATRSQRDQSPIHTRAKQRRPIKPSPIG